jgi:hypothetical protein
LGIGVGPDLPNDPYISPRRKIWLGITDSEIGGFDTGEYFRRLGKRFHQRISSVFEGSERLVDGT